MLGFLIVAAETGFWALLLAGLTARYVLRSRRLGLVLMAMTPLVDVVLLIATVVDLRGGAVATAWHSLAAVYLGVSIAFGHRMIAWADQRFAQRFAGGPAPVAPARTGAAHARHQRQGWYRHLLAFGIGVSLLAGGILLVGDASRTVAFTARIQQWTLILAVDFLWSFSYTLWPRSAGTGDVEPARAR
jgi:hypothetical protein